MHDVRVRLDRHEAVDVDRAVLADAAEVVAAEVDEHDVLGALLLVGEQLLGDPLVVLERRAARARAGDRPRRDVAAGDGQHRLGRGAGDLEVEEVQEVHVRARVDDPQPAVDRERVDVEVGRPALGGHDLKRVAGVDVLDDPRDVGLELLARHVRLKRGPRPGGRRRMARHGPGEQLADGLDRRHGAGVGGLEVAAVVVVGVDVDEHADRVAQVVEDHEHVGEHQRHVRQPDRVGVRLAQRLDRAHEVVAEVADGAAGERRHVRPRRLAVARDLGGGVAVGIGGLVAQRPAHDLARAHPDEAVAPDLLAALGGLEQERLRRRLAAAQLQEGRDRRLGVVDERVAQRDRVVLAGQLANLVEARLDAAGRLGQPRRPLRITPASPSERPRPRSSTARW